MKLLVLGILLVIVTAAAGQVDAPGSIAGTWKMLDGVRVGKKGQLERYLHLVGTTAHSILSDTLMCEIFRIKRAYYQLSKTTAPPPALAGRIGQLKTLVRERYLERYQLFYDILLIDVNGDVFYTVRKQADYHKNIFAGELTKTALARNLRGGATTMFIDYSYYTVSEEPTAFIIEPFLEGGRLIGWFVLQNAVNKINAMFSCGKEFGITGEVFLVNKTHFMLTDSRFLPSSTILSKQLSAKNIEEKFRERKGHKIVTDYRGYRAMTSFEVITVPGGEWLLIAKIDEDEVVTQQYRHDQAAMTTLLHKVGEITGSAAGRCDTVKKHCMQVDMDEFQRTGGDGCLTTSGVSTCTAVIISLPGRFSYMAHVSPYDRMYGGAETDLVGYIMKRISNLEIYPCEKRDLVFTVVSPVTAAFPGLVGYLTGQAVFLSQIRMVHRGAMRYADIQLDCVSGETVVEWAPIRKGEQPITENVGSLPTLGDLARSGHLKR